MSILESLSMGHIHLSIAYGICLLNIAFLIVKLLRALYHRRHLEY